VRDAHRLAAPAAPARPTGATAAAFVARVTCDGRVRDIRAVVWGTAGVLTRAAVGGRAGAGAGAAADLSNKMQHSRGCFSRTECAALAQRATHAWDFEAAALVDCCCCCAFHCARRSLRAAAAEVLAEDMFKK
jgi:hypothetical protein